MGRIPPELVEQILASSDIVSLIGEKVELKRVGSRYRGLCPFHNEKTPSFYVDPARQRYHCFGCGADGSAAGWLMEYENRSFPEALKILAQAANIPLVEEEETPQEKKDRAGRESALGALASANAHFVQQLWESESAAHARSYLESRGLDPETARKWDFGYAEANSRDFLNWAKTQKLTGRSLVDSGLASLREEDNPQAGLYARFRDRLMFPIRDANGRIVGFSGRILDPEAKAAKYINTPETPYFKKGHLLFGLDRARRAILKAKRVILCEGQLDCIALHQAGFPESLAPMGTATTPEHARQLARLGQEVILLFDGDRAGKAAAIRSAQIILPEGLSIRIAQLPEGEDPDSFLGQHGPTKLEALVDQASEFFTHLLSSSASTHSLESPQGRQQFTEELVQSLQLVPDTIVLDQLILQTAARLGVPDSEIRSRVDQARRRNQRQSRFQQAAKPAASRESNPNTDPSNSPNSSSSQSPEAEFALPQTPLAQHLCLLLLLPHSRPLLLENQQQILSWLEEFVRSPLPKLLLEAQFDPSQSASLNSALDSLPAKARQWTGQQLQYSPSAQATQEQQQQFAQEALHTLELQSHKRKLKICISQMKASAQLEPTKLQQLQQKIQQHRARIQELEQSSLANPSS